jgi:hypothetical protein
MLRMIRRLIRSLMVLTKTVSMASKKKMRMTKMKKPG